MDFYEGAARSAVSYVACERGGGDLLLEEQLQRWRLCLCLLWRPLLQSVLSLLIKSCSRVSLWLCNATHSFSVFSFPFGPHCVTFLLFQAGSSFVKFGLSSMVWQPVGSDHNLANTLWLHFQIGRQKCCCSLSLHGAHGLSHAFRFWGEL